MLVLDNKIDFDRELARIGADEASWRIFREKHETLAIKVCGLSTAGANILKQTALSCGADCAVHRSAASGRKRQSDAIVFATKRQLRGLMSRIRTQPECVARIVPGLVGVEERHCRVRRAIRIAGRSRDLGLRTHVMGVLNVTPDSFFDGGRYLDPGAAADRTREMAASGADFIDIGAESTRPGSEPVPAKTQLQRLLPVLRLVRKGVKVPISVDTTNAQVAQAALDAGAHMVNDVSAFTFDSRMAKTVARAGVPCVLMHMRGRPKTMQRRPRYRDLMAEIVGQLEAAVERGRQAGVEPGQLIVDPGIGFGKRLEHNYEIIRRLAELRSLGRPIMVGPGRKSFIGLTLGLGPEERLEGTLAACVLAAANGASILRVHDVKQAVRALRMADAILGRS